MKNYSRHFIIITLIIILSGISSCKTRYLETEASFQKAREKKKTLDLENKERKKNIAVLSDSLRILIEDYTVVSELSSKLMEIEELKKNFLDHRVEYYQELKKRQAQINK